MWLFFFYLIGALFLWSLAYAAVSLAPRAPTKKTDVEQIHEVAALQDGSLFVEIGCGDSTVSRWIAQKNPCSHVLWIELAFPLYLYSYLLKRFSWPSNFDVMYWDAFKYHFGKADVIYIFWIPKTVNSDIRKKAEMEMKPWAKLISYQFKLKGRSYGSVKTEKLKKGTWVLSVYTKWE